MERAVNFRATIFFLYDLMKQVNNFILKESPVSHYIEWSKKEECWEKIKQHTWAYNILDIEKDLVDDSQPIIRKEIFSETNKIIL